MRNTLNNIFTFSIALLVLVASMGFTINKHYCGGELMKVAINQQVDPCPMCKAEEAVPACHKEHESKKACCENEQDEVKTADYSIAKKIETQSISDFQFIALTYVLLADIHAADINSNSFYKDYSPPLIDHDIPVEVQSFLL